MWELLCIRDKINNLVKKSYQAFKLNIAILQRFAFLCHCVIILAKRKRSFWSSSTVLEFPEKVGKWRSGFLESSESVNIEWLNTKRLFPLHPWLVLQICTQCHKGGFVGAVEEGTLYIRVVALRIVSLKSSIPDIEKCLLTA